MRYATEMLRVRGLRTASRGPYDLDLAAGTVVGIEGESGSGKSLLLRMIADLDPSLGHVTLATRDRQDMTGPEWRSRVIYVPSEAGFWAASVREHFQAEPTLRAQLEEVGLAESMLDAPIARLSTGERQRVALVRALQRSPSFLLLDEPTSGLDARSAARVEETLLRRVASGLGILVVSHEAGQLQRLGARIHRMTRQGELLAS